MIEPSDEELIRFAVEEQFLLFCDEDSFIQIARAVLNRYAKPKGWKLAPHKATDDMVLAAEKLSTKVFIQEGDEPGYRALYEAMLDAAPKPGE